MKTPQEFLDSCQLAPGIWNGDVKSLIEQRDAEHRAELLKLQDDLLQAANREVMAEALIERLKGELGEAKRLLGSRAKKRNGACAWCDSTRVYWNGNTEHTKECEYAKKFLAAPPPAESTPVCTACPGPALLGACSHPGCEVNKESREVGRMLRENDKAGLAAYLNRNVADKAKRAVERIKAAPPDDIRERLSEALDNIERMKARYSEQSRELAAMEQERNNWRQQRVDVGLRYDLFKINHKGQGCGRREGDAALETKREPGTHTKGAKP